MMSRINLNQNIIVYSSYCKIYVTKIYEAECIRFRMCSAYFIYTVCWLNWYSSGLEIRHLRKGISVRIRGTPLLWVYSLMVKQ